MSEEIMDFEISGNVLDVLGAMTKTGEKNALRALAITALEPMRDDAKQRAPYLEGKTRDSIVIGTDLTSSARKAMREEPRGGIQMFLGTANRKAVPLEFGSIRARAFPFMRPAYEAQARVTINIVIDGLQAMVDEAAAKAASIPEKAL